MEAFAKAIIHTTAFYDAVGKVPLTYLELYKHLLSFRRPISFGEFLEQLDEHFEQIKPYIIRERGFIFLRSNREAYVKRIQAGKTSVEKWRIAARMTRIISCLPYVRMIALTGSLALQTTHRESDIDLLIVAKTGRIWTTRIVVSAAMQILGRRRHGSRVRDRICLNHFITDTNLTLLPKNLFSAHICASLAPMWARGEETQSFFAQNKAIINEHFPFWEEGGPEPYGSGRGAHLKMLSGKAYFSTACSRILEVVFEKLGAKMLESALRRLQTHKIRHNIAKQARPHSEGIYTDAALVFHHPRPQQQEALFLYRKNMRELLGII